MKLVKIPGTLLKIPVLWRFISKAFLVRWIFSGSSFRTFLKNPQSTRISTKVLVLLGFISEACKKSRNFVKNPGTFVKNLGTLRICKWSFFSQRVFKWEFFPYFS